MALLYGAKHLLHNLNLYLNCNKALRAISQEHPRSNTLPIFKALKLLRLQDVFQLKVIQGILIEEISSSLTKSLQYGLKLICYMGAKMWNDLPEEIRNSTSNLYSFKKNLKI